MEAYQTVLQLMGEEALFSYWDQTIKTSGTEWNVDVARQVLETWQRKFVSVSGCLVYCIHVAIVSTGH